MTDLMSYLWNAFSKELHEGKIKLPESLPDLGVKTYDLRLSEAFVEFCKKHLKGNPPTSVFMAVGLAFRMANGDEVQVVESPPEDGMPPESIPVTRPKSLPGQRGVTDTRSVPVFGGGK